MSQLTALNLELNQDLEKVTGFVGCISSCRLPAAWQSRLEM